MPSKHTEDARTLAHVERSITAFFALVAPSRSFRCWRELSVVPSRSRDLWPDAAMPDSLTVTNYTLIIES